MIASQKSVLLVEDDPSVALSIKEVLSTEGFKVTIVGTGNEALSILRRGEIDVALIDIGLPDMSGLDILKTLDEIRRYGVIMLTARNDTIDVVLALELGADDYIVKPFEPREFVARVRSVTRRFVLLREYVPEGPLRLAFRSWAFDPATRSVKKASGRIEKLTANETRLLRIFVENPNQILTRDRILDLLHPISSDIPFDRSIDVTIARLRRKIEPNARRPQFIKTAHGDGYIFDPKGE